MAKPKWLLIARNEYRIHLSRIRSIRPYFPFIVIGLLAVYVLFLAPAFVSLFVDDFVALIFSTTAVAMIQIVLFILFIYFIMIPISSTLREEQARELEIFLAAPVKPSDVLLGEFLGSVPFYAIFVTVVTGAFVALLAPLGLSIAQMALVVLIFVITFLIAFWIGTVVAALLRTKLGDTARGRDIGRALAMIIALPLVALIYGVQFGGLLEALANPETGGMVGTLLEQLPSSWGGEVILGFAANPGNLGANWIVTLTRVGGLIVFFLATLWLGTKVAGRAYSLEPTTFTGSKAKPDGVFYNAVRAVGGGGSFGGLLVSVFKDYSRRLENLSNMIYVIGLLLILTVFAVPTSEPLGPMYTLLMAQFLFPVLVVMINGEVTVRGKEGLMIFRKTPMGEAKLVKAMLVKGWLLAVSIAGLTTVLLTLLSHEASLVSLVINAGFMMLFIAGCTVFVLGLFLLNPAFSAKSMKMAINTMIAIFSSVGIFAVSMLLLMVFGLWSETTQGMIYVFSLQSALIWIVGVFVLYLGKKRLARIE